VVTPPERAPRSNARSSGIESAEMSTSESMLTSHHILNPEPGVRTRREEIGCADSHCDSRSAPLIASSSDLRIRISSSSTFRSALIIKRSWSSRVTASSDASLGWLAACVLVNHEV
jgi:hypothetical protein